MKPTFMEPGVLPMRSAKEQFAAAGCNSCLLTINAESLLHYVDSTAGKCVMEAGEYQAYKALCATWAEAPRDLKDAPGISMLEATMEEAEELELLTKIPRSFFAESFREIEQLLLSFHHALSEEERDDMILTLSAKIQPLKVAVLRAEAIWREQDLESEARHREDIDQLSLFNENEWLKLENERLKNELNEGGDAA